ncbi:Uncharacterised protein [BD1-7 clade bacterium]|uniref:Ketopantoate reductase C-terminal domain-containing protein n=1 Tax=BD1-7 clade bacterium TaxID=2029982 RepID=A0A5S9NXG2_9GAMM|nr:Uncharacterised protein [BD1-7 clade bacterium]CAA0095432.1 Uncharacterised protein [BD1-7 clade bacterium]
MQILVVGAGCIGLYIAQKLVRSQPDWQITLKARATGNTSTDLPSSPSSAIPANSSERDTRKQYIAKLCRQSGIQLISDYTSHQNQSVDAVILATKSDDAPTAARDLHNAGITSPHTLILYNGIIDPLDPPLPGQISRAITPAGYAFDASRADGLRVVNGEAAWRIAATPDAAKFWQNILTSADQAADIAPSNRAFVLRKYLINTAVNPLTAIYQRKVDELMDDPATHQRITQLLAETIAILQKDPRFSETMALLPSDDRLIQESLDFINTYRGHYTSTYHAFVAGDPVEIQSLTGYACRSAALSGAICDKNRQVQTDISAALERRDESAIAVSL